jgi:hypothetical protein
MYTEALYQTHALKGAAKSGRTAILMPEISSPTPNHRKNLTFIDGQETGPRNSMVPKVAETTPHVVPTRALFLQGPF